MNRLMKKGRAIAIQLRSGTLPTPTELTEIQAIRRDQDYTLQSQ